MQDRVYKAFGCLADLESLLSNGPYRAYHGMLWWLIGDTNWIKSTDHPGRGYLGA